MPEDKPIKITPAKGRPMLTWVGKRPLSQVRPFPAQHIETFDPAGDATRRAAMQDPWSDWPDSYPRGGLLFHGDNKEVLAHLLANGFRGKVKLVYIDPPFDSGADYVRRVRLRSAAGNSQIEGEGYTLGEQVQYEDIWANDNYLQFMHERLMLLKELLAEDGSMLLHCDYRKNAHLRCLLDEVLGPSNLRNEIIVRRGVKNLQAQFDSIDALSSGNDTIYLYSLATDTHYPKLEINLPEARQGTWNNHWRGTDRPTMRYELLGITPTSGQWRWSRDRSLRAVENYQEFLRVAERYSSIDEYYLEKKATGVELDFIRLSETGKPEHYVPPTESKLASSLWTDISAYDTGAPFPTQKSEELLDRIIGWLTNPGDIVLDCFIGSGTTAAVAQTLGRRWIACDINKGAIQTTSKRLQTIIQEQIAARANGRAKPLLEDEGTAPEPAQLSFTVWRVNDYDLQIQHNEAVNLACEHIGIQRSHTDPFFDGVLGRNLVKIIPFNHPLSPLDLEEIRRELDARPQEDRNITVVCLGKELAADAWVEDWNRMRKGSGSINRIELVELRTDPKYGRFFQHTPASAQVRVSREDGRIRVTIEDFVSPAVLERLKAQSGVLVPQIEDWRAMVDCVMIDHAYNGEVFNVALSDVPPKKNDLVSGVYTLPAPESETTVGVKIIDMLGEEVLVTERV